MTSLDILAIAGSLRSGSYNAALVRAAQRHAPDGMDVTIYDGLRDKCDCSLRLPIRPRGSRQSFSDSGCASK